MNFIKTFAFLVGFVVISAKSKSVEVTQQNGGLRIIDQKCMEYSQLVYENVTNSDGVVKKVDKCGFIDLPTIRDGSSVKPGEYPHLARVGFGAEESLRWVCSGSIISPRYILTVAHCVHSQNGESPTFVTVGKVDLEKDQPGEDPQTIPVESFIVHHEYAPSRFYNDIALMKLSREIKFSPFVRPACLNTKFEIAESKAVVAGWGQTEFLGSESPGIQNISLDLYTFAECHSTYGRIRNLPNGINDSQHLCAGFRHEDSKTICTYSGGPLQIKHQQHCMYNIVGITSFGRGCAEHNTPDAFTRVSAYVDWIEENAFAQG